MQYEISKQMLASLIRHLITIVASWLIAKNVVPEELVNAWIGEATAVVAGVLLLLITFGWKYLNAKFNVLALIAAVQHDPPADTPKEVVAAVEEVKAEVKADNTVLSA